MTAAKADKMGFRLFWLVLFLFTAAVTAYDFSLIIREKRENSDSKIDEIAKEVAAQAADVSSQLKSVRLTVSGLADQIAGSGLTPTCSAASLDRQECPLQLSIQERMSSLETVSGLGVAIEPYQKVEKGNVHRSSLYYFSDQSGEFVETPIDYDYTAFKESWYRKPRLEGSTWNEPYWGEASQATLAEYAARFSVSSDMGDTIHGVVFGSISAEDIRKIVSFNNEAVVDFQLLSKSGRFVLRPQKFAGKSSSGASEPTRQTTQDNDSIFEYAWREGDPRLNSIAMRALEKAESADEEADIGRYKLIETHVSARTGELLHILAYPVIDTDWSLIVVVSDDALHDDDSMRQQWFKLVPMLIVTLALAIVPLVIFPRSAWISPLYFSIIFSLVVFGGVYALWAFSGLYPQGYAQEEEKISSRNGLAQFENDLRETKSRSPVFVDTGVLIQSIEFAGANNLKVTAYVWQDFEKGVHANTRRGFLLPEAEDPTINEVFRELDDPDDPACHVESAVRDCSERIGSYVAATLRQDFDYGLYPLDSQRVWLKIWPLDFDDAVVLVPDLDSYARLSPKILPGVQQPFVLPGWRLDQSWFSAVDQEFSTNFGDGAMTDQISRKELLFNVRIRREFLNPFVSRIIPLVLVAILMFLIVLISTKSSSESEWLGFSASNTVAGLSALFFVVGINHADLRQHLTSPTIMYFEYFYFVVYAMLLYVAVSSIRIAKNKFVEGRDENLASSVAYWPVLSLVLFGLTFWVFY